MLMHEQLEKEKLVRQATGDNWWSLSEGKTKRDPEQRGSFPYKWTHLFYF